MCCRKPDRTSDSVSLPFARFVQKLAYRQGFIAAVLDELGGERRWADSEPKAEASREMMASHCSARATAGFGSQIPSRLARLLLGCGGFWRACLLRLAPCLPTCESQLVGLSRCLPAIPRCRRPPLGRPAAAERPLPAVLACAVPRPLPQRRDGAAVTGVFRFAAIRQPMPPLSPFGALRGLPWCNPNADRRGRIACTAQIR